jgi:preprotein translocase subunit Sec61beta
MAKKKSEGSGLMSSAGLMRYFEADSTAIKLDPKTVIAVSAATGVAIMTMNAYFGLWP